MQIRQLRYVGAGPSPLAQRLTDLEQTPGPGGRRCRPRLRGPERDLHDGAQIQLATLAMNPGMAKKRLGDHSDEVPDAEAARELAGARNQTITYFCAAELLANAAKHSANKIKIDLSSSHMISSWPAKTPEVTFFRCSSPASIRINEAIRLGRDDVLLASGMTSGSSSTA